jgi:4'-phosphopantetheinyl transferase
MRMPEAHAACAEPRAAHAPAAGEVHIWAARLDLGTPALQALRATLSPDELARAERFVFRRDRERFVAARGTLRAVLANYAGIPPGALVFDYSAFGKPVLRGGGTLRFNLSHAGEIAVIGIVHGREIGVDVEAIRPAFAGEEIAARFFSPAEVAALRALPPEQQAIGFFNCWTRKEAYIKALGEGLSHPLDSFDVSLAPGEPAALLAVRGAPAVEWSLHTFVPAPGYVAAAAVAGRGHRLVFHELAL